MAIRYFYIDDDEISTIKEIAKGLSISPNRLVVIAHQHTRWAEEIQFIIESQDEFDGLLIDWSLNQKNESGETANYVVEALAQQLRRLIIEKNRIKKDFPIVLCSAKHKFKTIYKKELTSHDLFDEVYEKDLFNEETEKTIQELYALSKGYKYIKEYIEYSAPVRSSIKILGVDSKEDVDYRLFDYLEDLIRGKKPIHEISRFLLTNIIKVNGVLINRYLLAARLGVDITNKGHIKDWLKVLNQLKVFKYSGAFQYFNDKWWMKNILEWWEKEFKVSLGELEAKDRVEMLNSKYNIKLQTAQTTEKSDSSYFWTICNLTKKPIALEDSILITKNINKFPWLEDIYISIDESLKINSKELHPLERKRVKKLKKMYDKPK